VLWTCGASLLHSGVVINGKEYAYGGHEKRGVTGVYWTKPKTEPPGGTFKCEILHGFSFATAEEIEKILKETSEEFQGTSYNLLTKNCNHFTSYLCNRLIGRPGPGWLNRAASIGVALPCVVPRQWIDPPEYDAAEGELMGDEEERHDERTRMLAQSPPRLLAEFQCNQSEEWDSEEEQSHSGNRQGKRVSGGYQTSGQRLQADSRSTSA
jgi:deubiquitinase DESI2